TKTKQATESANFLWISMSYLAIRDRDSSIDERCASMAYSERSATSSGSTSPAGVVTVGGEVSDVEVTADVVSVEVPDVVSDAGSAIVVSDAAPVACACSSGT